MIKHARTYIGEREVCGLCFCRVRSGEPLAELQLWAEDKVMYELLTLCADCLCSEELSDYVGWEADNLRGRAVVLDRFAKVCETDTQIHRLRQKIERAQARRTT